LCLQNILYDEGNYNCGKSDSDASGSISGSDIDNEALSGQVEDGIKRADGLNPYFMEWYTVLENLNDITVINDNNNGEFLMLYNGTTHEPAMLQLPYYEPQVHVDNTAFDFEDNYTLNGVTMHLDDCYRIDHYQVNMAALLRLAEWFDYLREEGVYDNTRIIIVADHGCGLGWFNNFIIPDTYQTCEWYLPLFMVKDFNSHGFEISNEFMTNADTCFMAVDGVIDNPINPFTGNVLNCHEKYEDKIRVTGSDVFNFYVNNGYTFVPSDWYSVSGNPYDKTNWEYLGYE
jgi:hypothetical protein